jgi:hypothetical protein
MAFTRRLMLWRYVVTFNLWQEKKWGQTPLICLALPMPSYFKNSLFVDGKGEGE